MNTFVLIRDEDESGVSGTGTVAEGCVFTDRHVALRWLSKPMEVPAGSGVWLNVASSGLYDSVPEMMAIHGHNGKTRIEFTSGGLP